MTGEQLSPIEKAKSNIELALRKNSELYHQLADSDKALTLADLNATERGATLIRSDEFRELVTLIDWPDSSDRNTMTWDLAFHDNPDADEAFADALFAKTNPLNNTLAYMTVPKQSLQDTQRFGHSGNMVNDVYGTAPCRLRAEMVIPELFAGLHEFDEAVGHRRLLDYLNANNDEYQDIIHAMRVAYTLLGRCMRSDDPDRHHMMLFGEVRQSRRVTDISDELQT